MPRLVTKPRFLPHSVMEDLVDLHGAVDPDTGHLICHYYAIAPVIVEIAGRKFPGLNVGECMTIVQGQDAVAAAEEEGERVELSEIDAKGGVNGISVDAASLALALSHVRNAGGKLRLLAPRSGEDAVIVVFDSDGEESIVVIVWKCREKRGAGAVLQV